ncbi:hypothetical protein Egran_00661 [Elaphomyces granulatus]|uniref:RING-type E3 ubiquitin transferase n=1 Tax=Elaphomyces granulatus TaxID=519963 RepID=A0A232M5F7_9EURO|nr:hypothetical protein Egran_00661 [Elaphomyces granulatus]
MRLAAYAGVSLALAAGVILKALHQRANFYAACVYLSQSSANLMILTNICLVAVAFFLYGLQRLLYGHLRPIETEQLYEKAWFAVTETCLAMTIFRGELGGWFLVMFVCLLAGKVWGWIGEGRVEILEQQSPANPYLFHARLAASLVLSVAFDLLILIYCAKTVLKQARPDMMVMFGFEFAVLTILSTSTVIRYLISLFEIQINHRQKRAKLEERRAELRAAREEAVRQHQESGGEGLPDNLPNENDVDEMELDVPGWEEKGRWVFYLDLLTDFLKLIVYLAFFAILFTFYGLPIHILRDVIVTIRSFGRRVIDFLRYRNATRDMNERYPDATPEEIAREDVCIICREEMVAWQHPDGAPGQANGTRPPGGTSDRLRPKKLPCGHILHFSCLRSWLERQQNCPTCRRPVVESRNRAHQGDGINGGRGNGGGLQPGVDQPAGANRQAGDGQARARVYQFGPFRIGFGAGRGDLFQNFHQQLNQGNAPLQQQQQQPAAAAGQAVPGIGFGFGFGRAAPPPPPPPTNLTNFQAQLLQIEQQIMQEVNSLRVTTDQLHVVRLLQAEMQRLRAVQANANRPGIASPNAPVAPSSVFPTPPPAMTVQRQFTSNPLTPAIGAGDSRLPEGLTLPPGWNLLPLHRVDPATGAVALPTPMPAPPTAPPTSLPSLLNPVNSGPSVLPVGTDVPNDNSPGQSLGNLPNDAEGLRSLQTHSQHPASKEETVEPATNSSRRGSSPSQDWTDVAADRVPVETLPAPTEVVMGEEGMREMAGNTDGQSGPSSSSSSSSAKGKGRAATVEDLADECD